MTGAHGKKRARIPNKDRAIVTGKIATIHHGRRVVNFYRSGQPLIGKVPQGREGML